MNSQEPPMDASSLHDSSFMDYVNNLFPGESVNSTQASLEFCPLNFQPPLSASPRVNSQPLEISPTDNRVRSVEDSMNLSCQTQAAGETQMEEAAVATNVNSTIGSEIGLNLQRFASLQSAGIQDKRPLSYENFGNSHEPIQPTSQIFWNSQQINQPRSPQKRRQKISSNSGGVTRKPCNCKRSQCIKLYCDCFASGEFCGEHCACRCCFNRKEHENTVAEIRNQVKCRKPYAFESMITRVDHGTSSSLRHKRGCNCKKSACQKKYCECYQAGVGCSKICRCEGCKNMYGRREDHGVVEVAESQRRLEIVSDSKPYHNMGMVTDQRDSFHEMNHFTPALQFSNQVQCQPSLEILEKRVIPKGNGVMNQTLLERSGSVPNLYQYALTNPHTNNSVFPGTGWPMTRFSENEISRLLERNNEITLHDILRLLMLGI